MQNNSVKQLTEHGYQLLKSCSDSARLDAQILLCFVLNKETSYLHTWPENTVEGDEVKQYQGLLQRRLTGEPIAYITGLKEFWSLPFYCTPATLIPRPDTEVLVEQVLQYGQEKNSSLINCLDLGTGTGAIALALASEMPTWTIEAIDYSIDAVNLAKKNAQHLGLTNVDIYQSDWFGQVDNNKKFDIVISNPPYIEAKDVHLTHGDVRFEPLSALVSSNDGLADIILIAKMAKNYLSASGVIFFEHGYDQAEAVKNILIELNYFEVKTVKDFGNNDRVTWAKFLASE